MESRQKKRLGDMLIEEQIITDEQLSDALEKKKGTTKRLGEVLVIPVRRILPRHCQASLDWK